MAVVVVSVERGAELQTEEVDPGGPKNTIHWLGVLFNYPLLIGIYRETNVIKISWGWFTWFFWHWVYLTTQYLDIIMWSISLQFAWEQLQCRRMGLGLLVNDCCKEGNIVTILILLDLISSSLSAFEKPLYGRWRKCRQNLLPTYHPGKYCLAQYSIWAIFGGFKINFGAFCMVQYSILVVSWGSK